jgi:GT2 family glycosyltransferase
MIPVVVIPVLGQHDLLERCVKSLVWCVDTLILVDNGDELEEATVRSWLDDDDPMRVYVWRMPNGLSVAGSWNLGIKAMPYSPGWLLLNSDAWFAHDPFEEYVRELEPDRIVLAGSPPWCCAWIGRDVVQRVGLFCERFHPAYFEDNDYEQRARIMGIPVEYSSVDVRHDNSSTLERNPEYQAHNARTFAANQAYMQYRWANVEADGLPATADWDLATRVRNGWEK